MIPLDTLSRSSCLAGSSYLGSPGTKVVRRGFVVRRHCILQREEDASGGREGRRQSKRKEERSALEFIAASFENERRLD